MRMRITFVVLLCAMILSGLAGVALAQPVPPFDTNAECLECHDLAVAGSAISKVDFSAPGTVSLERCRACHQDNYMAYDHPHFTGDCFNCHNGDDEFYFPSEARLNYPTATPYGFFWSTASLSATPAQIHAAHSGRSSWVEPTFATDYPQCSTCHAPAACSACHAGTVAHTDHASSAYPAVTLKQATGTSVTYAPSTCVNAACHPIAAAGSSTFVPACTSCHPTRTATHGYDTVDHVADDSGVEGTACSACHALDLSTEHQKSTSSSSGSGCATCHPAPRDTVGAWDQSCVTGGCHSLGSAAPMHAGATGAHAVVPAGELCLGCHGGTDLGSIHATATSSEGDSCLVCHTPGGTPTSGDCTVCHFTFENHYDTTRHTSSWDLATCGGSGCHSTRDLMGAHAEKNPDFECADCHSSADGAVAAAISGGNTGCGGCHAGVSETSGHRGAHWANPMLQDSTGPHYSYWSGSEGTSPTGDCAGCHTSNLIDEHLGIVDSDTGNSIRLPRKDSTGAALTCASCHSSLDGDVVNALVMGFTNCDSCHVVHGPINQVHSSTYADEQQVPCAGCHEANLVDVHDGGYTVVTPDGTVLAGCDVCHAYYETPRGTVVQAAISETNDTRCTACHDLTHPDLDGHAASSATSLECGTCHAVTSNGAIDIRAVHAGVTSGPCSVCHDNPSRVPSILSVTAECDSCHPGHGDLTALHTAEASFDCVRCHEDADVRALHPDCSACHDGSPLPASVECANCHGASGSDYHAEMSVQHTFSAMPEDCVAAGCHASNSLPSEHARFLGGYPQYVDTCALCHLNADSGRIDWSAVSADCSTCHTVHGNLDVIHQAPSSSECVACHETTDVRVVHPSCATCHNGTVDTSGTAACVNCHAAVSPTDPQHYAAVPHTANESSGCANCHSLEMKPEHSKATAGPVTCAQCHEEKVDNFTSAWNKTCAACHPTKHVDEAAKHKSTTSACSGSTCHNVNDVSTIHATCTSCHTATTIPTTTTCTACHAGTVHTLREPIGACASSSGCHGPGSSYIHGRYAHQQTACTTCHGSAAPGCAASGCHSRAEIHGESRHQNAGCTTCHVSGIEKPHTTITLKMTTDTTWRTVCGSCHGRTHSYGSCRNCHSTDQRADVHDESSHTSSNTRCQSCHNVATGDRAYDCRLCHPDSSSDSWGDGDSWGGGGWGR